MKCLTMTKIRIIMSLTNKKQQKNLIICMCVKIMSFKNGGMTYVEK